MRSSPLFLISFVSVSLCAVGGCPPTGAGSADPNGAVAGDVVQFLPAVVSLEIDELPEDGDTLDSAQLGPVRNTYQRVARSAATVVHRFQRMADRGLALGARIHQDMVDANSVQVSGTFTVAGEQVAYKADFSAFDFDGDGVDDGSGNAVDLPVAVRIWTDRGDGYVQFMCALVAQKPSSDNYGQGQVYVRPDAVHADAPEGVQIHVNYDRTAGAHRWNEAFVSGALHPLHRLNIGRARVDVRTNAGGELEKTVRGTYTYSQNPYGFTTFQSACHWLVGGTGLLMSATASGDGVQVSFEDFCVDLESRTPAEDGACDDFDTQDMTVLAAPNGDEADFPDDFPETPTF